jgi:hypothetical protein
MNVIYIYIYIYSYVIDDSRDSSVGIATGYWLVYKVARIFSTSSRPALIPTQLPVQLVQVTFSAGVKRPGRETDHSPSPSSEVKRGSVHSLPHTPSWRSA